MRIHKYESYASYVQAQEEANRVKITHVWVAKQTIEKIARDYGRSPSSILCHGTRNGKELSYFSSLYPKATVVGTEISETAENFANTVRWDFHKERSSWVGAFDIVYSNSLDHSIDPSTALGTWARQLSPQGKLYIEYSFSPADNKSSAWDPLEINEEELLPLFAAAGLELVNKFDVKAANNKSTDTVFVLRKSN